MYTFRIVWATLTILVLPLSYFYGFHRPDAGLTILLAWPLFGIMALILIAIPSGRK